MKKPLAKLKKFSCPNSPKSRITYHLKSCTYCRTGYIYIQHWGEDIAFFPLGAHKCKIAIFIPTCSCHKINQKMWHFNMWGMHLHILFFSKHLLHRTRFLWFIQRLDDVQSQFNCVCSFIVKKCSSWIFRLDLVILAWVRASIMIFIHCLCHIKRINWKWKKILTFI